MFKRWLHLLPENLLLIGPRRSGKTTLLKSVLNEFRYVTLDDFDFLSWAQSDPKGFVQQLGPRAIIDEIQRYPQLTVAVKQFIDEKSLTVAMTGSSSIGLLDSTADSLAGRIRLIHFPTACWGEEEGEPTHSFLEDTVPPLEILKAKRKFEMALTYGGFPEVVSQLEGEAKNEILTNYRNTYFTRDLAQLSNIENIEGLLAILHHASRSLGSHLEVSNFAQESGLSHPSAKKYLNTLVQSGLAFKLYGYHFGPAKRYLKAAKLYFSDTGILKALRQSLSSGQLIENFVISELEKRRKLGFIKADQFYYYKSVGGAEIDLLFEDEEECLNIIEIKASEKLRPRDTTTINEFVKQNKKRKIRARIVYLGTEYQELNGVQCLPIYGLHRGK